MLIRFLSGWADIESFEDSVDFINRFAGFLGEFFDSHVGMMLIEFDDFQV